ncbi:ABC-type nitrate/sulfonate/bicarbonate transport system, substrate-binding protein [Sanguibacter gelidistatuariae]|uniref:ABC-type nitrate/sulfonate/bicarbonate transport system, substrate-binding protein n=1 Tax=Sanguibacter gelidistatuariae TaxID=1814289 RepID=A0A1G6P368_9MICO|nr:ABC transporter substrate-binding protein [Sanguibacter gelidistatuariae]SDC74391.1 ABC-type nitrate/sulfonate/bicarbonate transport system, substrate-binding protein [Sanguibacter gelidistatuariae]
MFFATARRCRAIIATGAAIAAALALAGCSTTSPAATGGSQANALRKVSVVLDWTPNTNHSGLYVAQTEGYFAARGLDVTIIEPGETSGLDLVAAGQADLAYSVAESLVPARQAGADVVSVATIIQHNTSSLISLTSSGITRPRDLEGRSYGTYGSDLEKALIRKLVTCDGGDPDKVTFAPLGSDDFRIGLTQNQFDVAWVFDAWDTIRLRDVDHLDVSTIAFSDHTDCIPDWYTPLLATSGKTITKNPQLVRDFLAALSEGYQKAISDPPLAADDLLKAAPELDRGLVERSANYLATRYTDDPARWGQQDAVVWNGFVGFLEDNDLIKPGFDTAAAWTDDYLPH